MHSYPWLDSGNTIYKYLLGFQLFLTLAIGFYTDTMVTGMLIGGLIVVLPFILFTLKRDAVYTRHIAAIASQLLVALHIQQSGGATFMHFEIFAVMAATTVYRDWKIVVSSVLTVAIHHIGFYALQVSGSGLVIFEPENLTLYILAIHAGFAISEGLILCFISHQAFKDGRAALDLQLAIEKMMRTEGAFDLNVSIDNKAKTNIQFVGLIEAFSSFISETKLVSSNLSSVSSNVSALSDNVRTASNNTSSQVHTIAAAIEEMTVNNEDVSQRASSVSGLSNEAKVSSMKARGTIVDSNSEVKSLTGDLQETANTIGSLSDKCKQIESVMASISAISDQTNLLALNAAIESARAGEHGRGFAVVADEVRQLAMRTKENSTQISEITHLLIQESTASVAKMQSCVEKSEKVAGSSESTMQIIDEVVDIVGSVNDNIGSVSLAINEQSLASSEISKSTQSLSTTSEVLSTNAGKTDEASADLTDNIEKLQNKLAQFTL